MQTIYRQRVAVGGILQRIYSIKKHYLRILITVIAVIFVFASCKKELDAPEIMPLETGLLSASEDAVVIDASLPNDTAIVFTWDAYPNPLIDYVLVFTSNEKTDSAAIVNNTVGKSLSNSQLNTILVDNLGLAVGLSVDVQVELLAYIPTNGKTASSNTITIKMTPAKVGPAFTELGITGDATPNGWSIDNSNVMYVDVFNPYIFRYNEVLNAGEFKIPTIVGGTEWSIPTYRPLTNNPDISDSGVLLAEVGSPEDNADNKWRITDEGPYKIALDILNKTINITSFTPYPQIWLVGNATPDNWNIDSPTPMVQTVGNPYEFIYTGSLNVGEFKIPTATGNWGCDFFRPAVNNPALTDTRAPFAPNGFDPSDKDDYKWSISTAGNYKITFNQLYETIKIEQQ